MGPSTSYDHPQQLSCEIAIHQSKNVEEFMITNSGGSRMDHDTGPFRQIIINWAKSEKLLGQFIYIHENTYSLVALDSKVGWAAARGTPPPDPPLITNKYYSKPHGNLFVRYYLSSGNNNNNKIQLETREIPSSSGHLSWNESFSLDCSGTQDSINDLKSSSVAFELRWRPSSRSNILGCRAGSKRVGSGEVMWRSVMESSGMEIETWVVMCPKNSKRCDGVKPPSVKIGMRVVSVPTSMTKKNEKSYECGCSRRHSGYHSCGDLDALALVAAFEAL
ncbi:hypothetical protein LINPERHAP2_LOCUS40635 [Linum perenne]